MGFSIAFSNVLVALIYVILGFCLVKMKKAQPDHLSTLSAVLVYICGPCMVINAFLSLEYSTENFIKMLWFFLVSLLAQALFMLICYFVLRKKFDDSKYKVFTIGTVMGNVGFFGLPIINALIPTNPEVGSYSCMYVMSMNLLVFTIGSFLLTGDKKFISVKAAVFNPTTFGIAIGIPLYLLGGSTFIPSVVKNGLSLLGGMTTPLCMIILGIRLASVDLVKLFTRPVIYATCLMKLVVFPLFCYALVYFLPFDQAFKSSMLILSGVPCASIILNLAEMYKCNREQAANSVLVSTILCLITIPLLTLIV